MGNAAGNGQPSVLELARSGNVRAIAYWLNVFLLPHNLYAQVNPTDRPDRIQVLVEFQLSPEIDARSLEFQKSLVRFVCHHVWKLNSEDIEGVQVVARYLGQPEPLWKQSVRVLSPARRAKLGQSAKTMTRRFDETQIRNKIRKVKLQKIQFRALRSLLLTGTTAAAFIVGCWLGFADAPSEQTNASATNSAVTVRPDTVTAALETVPVEKPDTQHTTDDTATLIFGGDVALTNAYSDLVGSDRTWAFSALDDLRQADVSLVNLEAPFTAATEPQAGETEPIKADPANAEVLKNGGINLVNLANSRTMDYQATGLEDTLKTLEQAGIRHIGAGRSAKDARRPEILDVDGQRIAYLGYADGDLHSASETTPGTNARSNDRIAADIQAIRSQVDWVVVNFHWGEDLSKYPSDAQIGLAHFTIEQGADLVVGHHSSMLQGAEIYKGRPIVYSLGNFIFGGSSQSDYDTAMLKVGLKDKQMKVELLPVEVKGFQPRIVSGDRGQEILQQIENVSDVFQQPLKSPVILDANANTVISQPESKSVESHPADSASPVAPSESTTAPGPIPNSPTESPVPSESTESQPAESSTESTSPDSQPTESPAESRSPERQPSDSQTEPTSPESQPTESQPTESPTPIESASPESQSSPSGETTSASPTAEPQSEKPWNSNSFTSPGAPSSPMVPQQEVTPAPSESPSNQGTILEPASSPANSLEPIKRRYANAELNRISLNP